MKEKHKTIRLGYGEYYDLRVTDASKNVINQVEITPVSISTELVQLSPNSNKDDLEKIKSDFVEELQRGMGSEDNDIDDKEFLSWQYVQGPITRHTQHLNIPGKDGTTFSIHHPDFDALDKGRELKVEIQVAERHWITRRRWCWLRGIITERVLTPWQYYWSKEIAIPTIKNQYDKTVCEIQLNRSQINAIARINDLNWADIELRNWRYKLEGGEIRVDQQPKQVFSDLESQLLRGVQSYTYPESTLIQDDARLGTSPTDPLLVEHIGNHILNQYRHGRETILLKWQGDPRITIGDSIILTDKMGIETEYMVTGNQFNLDSKGKFSMQTEGISKIAT